MLNLHRGVRPMVRRRPAPRRVHAGRRVVTLSVDGTTYFRVELPRRRTAPSGSGHEFFTNVFERDGLG